MERKNVLELYALDPAGDIPESELRGLVRENPAGGAITPTVVAVTIGLTTAVASYLACPTSACSFECPK